LADPPELVERTDIPQRFVVQDQSKDGVVQNYPGRTAAEVRPGVRAAPRTPVVAYVWDDDVSDQDLEALRLRAARVGYLGCSDSPVAVEVSRGPAPVEIGVWLPGAEVGAALPVPYAGFTGELDRAFDRWSAGEATRRSWISSRRERYAPARGADEAGPLAVPTLIWLQFDRSVSARRCLAVAETLKKAVLDHYDRLTDDDQGVAGLRAPWWLHGHDIPDTVARPYQLARFLPLLNVGHARSDGAIHGAAIWLPLDCPPTVIEGVRSASSRIRQLRGPGVDVKVSPRNDARGKWTTWPDRWLGPSEHWFSATPAVAERGARGGPDVDEVRQWFVHAGHPEPISVSVSPVPTRSGVPRLRAGDVHREDRDRYPFLWLEVEFDGPVTGPLCVGRSRSFGLGLLAPDSVSRALQRKNGERR
jgi:CRISPR-associated protein Csb2